MAVIGFVGESKDHPRKEQELSDTEKELEENKSVTERVEEVMDGIYLSEKRKKQMLAGYETVVVHDFNDDYNLSDEEREERNAFYKKFHRLNKCKRKYRKIDEYVDACRISIECLEAVAETNMVYSKDKFMAKAMDGKINVFGWFYPKYTGKDKKKLNWEYINNFILGDEDPSVLVQPRERMDIESEDELEDLKYILFDKDELDEIIERACDKDEEDDYERSIDEDDEDVKYSSEIADPMKKKDKKFIKKILPDIGNVTKAFDKSAEAKRKIASFVSDISTDDFSFIDDYDEEMGFDTGSRIPKFKGNIESDEDYECYMAALDEFDQTQFKYNYNGVMLTKEEINELELKSALDEAGWNIRKLYDNEKIAKEDKKARKKDKKKEKELKRELLEVQKRSKARMEGIDVDNDDRYNGKISKKKKKKLKKEEKKKKKLKKKMKKKMKEGNEEEANDEFNKFLLKTASDMEENQNFVSFNEIQDRMQEMVDEYQNR